MNIAKFLRIAFYIEHLWWLLLDSNLTLAMQILKKKKKKLFLYFDNSHVVLSAYNRVTYLDQTQAIM